MKPRIMKCVVTLQNDPMQESLEYPESGVSIPLINGMSTNCELKNVISTYKIGVVIVIPYYLLPLPI